MSDTDWDSDGEWGDGDDGGAWEEPSYEEQELMGEVPSQANPVLPPSVDAAIHSPPLKQTSQASAQMPPQQKQAPSLVGKFDAHGRPVACCKMAMHNGKPVQITAWKTPNADEYNALMYQSKRMVVQGGVAAQNVSTATNAAATNEMVPLSGAPQSGWKKAAKIAAGAAVVGGIYWGYKTMKDS